VKRWYECREEGIYLKVKAVPGARQSAVVGLLGDRLKIRISAAPEGGKANTAIRELLAEAISCRVGDVKLISGASSPEKVFCLPTTTPAVLEKLAGD